MTLTERIGWSDAFEPPDIAAQTFDDLLEELVLTDAPRSVQIRVLTAHVARLPLHLAEEAASRGLAPPPHLP